jgi:zinc/manganese transport system ATP-binding protein
MTLTLNNLTLGYERHPAVHHVSATFTKGSMTAIIGANGAGKSTLLKGIAGELKPLSGEIICKASKIYLPQNPQFNFDLPVTLSDFVHFAKPSAHKHHEALHLMKLEGFAKTLMSGLSGGQLQRAIFARLLVSNADLILLDEPFSAMDSVIIETAMMALKAMNKTVIAVLHDYDLVQKNFPQCLMLARELIAYGETKDVLTDENLAKAAALREHFDEEAEHCHD